MGEMLHQDTLNSGFSVLGYNIQCSYSKYQNNHKHSN